MLLKVIVDDQLLELNVPEALIAQAGDFFDKMDRDMDAGWQMDREWVPEPNRLQRGQIAADKLLTALENEDHNLGRMMAAYILARLPETDTIELDVSGEMQNHLFSFAGGQPPEITEVPAPGGHRPDAESLATADAQVSTVFKVGKQYRFSVLDNVSGEWENSAAYPDEAAAEAARQRAVQQRAFELSQSGEA